MVCRVLVLGKFCGEFGPGSTASSRRCFVRVFTRFSKYILFIYFFFLWENCRPLLRPGASRWRDANVLGRRPVSPATPLPTVALAVTVGSEFQWFSNRGTVVRVHRRRHVLFAVYSMQLLVSPKTEVMIFRRSRRGTGRTRSPGLHTVVLPSVSDRHTYNAKKSE